MSYDLWLCQRRCCRVQTLSGQHPGDCPCGTWFSYEGTVDEPVPGVPIVEGAPAGYVPSALRPGAERRPA